MKSLIVLLVLLAISFPAFASTVILQWDPNTEPDLAGYNLYQQTGSATIPFIKQPQVIKTGTNTVTIANLDPTKAYFFAITAYNTAGQESTYSNIVHTSPFPKAPTGVRTVTIVIN